MVNGLTIEIEMTKISVLNEKFLKHLFVLVSITLIPSELSSCFEYERLSSQKPLMNVGNSKPILVKDYRFLEFHYYKSLRQQK